MNVERFSVGPLDTNCYLVMCEKTRESVLIDPGGMSEELLEAVINVKITAILLTHGHFDHIGGVGKAAETTGAPILIHERDAAMLDDPALNGSFMIGMEIKTPGAAEFLSDGDEVAVGESRLSVIHTPGHTEGGVSFAADSDFIIAGDTLFRLSVGRWDLPGGDYGTLMRTLQNIFAGMPDQMVVYPGHGETTTIGFEKNNNQFLAGM